MYNIHTRIQHLYIVCMHMLCKYILLGLSLILHTSNMCNVIINFYHKSLQSGQCNANKTCFPNQNCTKHHSKQFRYHCATCTSIRQNPFLFKTAPSPLISKLSQHVKVPGESYRRRLRSLFCLCDILRSLINSLVCRFCTDALFLVLFHVVTTYSVANM